MAVQKSESGVEWVRQEDRKGCAIAVAAMIAGVSYQEARTAICKLDPAAADHGAGDDSVRPFLQSHGWERIGFSRGPLWGEYGKTVGFVEGADLTFCVIHNSNLSNHAVLILPDGTVLDPAYSHPWPSIQCCPVVDYVEGWRRIRKETSGIMSPASTLALLSE